MVSRLRDAGAIIAGKTNLDEFGMGSHSVHSHFGPVIQQQSRGQGDVDPLAEKRSAGGSSGGSAVAVATDQCWAALGTDTGGSVRLPAAYTGTVGFKPSYGLLSRRGVIAYANSLDTVGILSRNVTAARAIHEALNAYDPQDPTSLTSQTRDAIASATTHLGKRRSQTLRIGIPAEYSIAELSPSIRSAWVTSLRTLTNTNKSISLIPISLPTTPQALSAYYVLAPAEASSNLAKYDGIRFGSRGPSPSDASADGLFATTRGAGFGPEVKRRIVLGAYTLSATAMDNYFIAAQRVRRLVQRDFDRVFVAGNPLHDGGDGVAGDDGGVDVLLHPTAPTLPPTIEEVRSQSPLEGYVNDVFTVPASLAGLPAVSVPVPCGDGQVCGMQVVGQFGDDGLVLDVAEMLETVSK